MNRVAALAFFVLVVASCEREQSPSVAPSSATASVTVVIELTAVARTHFPDTYVLLEPGEQVHLAELPPPGERDWPDHPKYFLRVAQFANVPVGASYRVRLLAHPPDDAETNEPAAVLPHDLRFEVPASATSPHQVVLDVIGTTFPRNEIRDFGSVNACDPSKFVIQGDKFHPNVTVSRRKDADAFAVLAGRMRQRIPESDPTRSTAPKENAVVRVGGWASTKDALDIAKAFTGVTFTADGKPPESFQLYRVAVVGDGQTAFPHDMNGPRTCSKCRCDDRERARAWMEYAMQISREPQEHGSLLAFARALTLDPKIAPPDSAAPGQLARFEKAKTNMAARKGATKLVETGPGLSKDEVAKSLLEMTAPLAHCMLTTESSRVKGRFKLDIGANGIACCLRQWSEEDARRAGQPGADGASRRPPDFLRAVEKTGAHGGPRRCVNSVLAAAEFPTPKTPSWVTFDFRVEDR